MLKNLDPLLIPELLYVLRAMGHGDVLTIVDNSGRFVKELSSLSGSQLKVDISNLSRGVYFITSHDKSIIRKFVKQ